MNRREGNDSTNALWGGSEDEEYMSMETEKYVGLTSQSFAGPGTLGVGQIPPEEMSTRARSLTIGSKDDLEKKTTSQEQDGREVVTNGNDGGNHPKRRNQPSLEETGGASPTDQPHGRVVQVKGEKTPHQVVSVTTPKGDGTGLDHARPTASPGIAGYNGGNTDDGPFDENSPCMMKLDSGGEVDHGYRGENYYGDGEYYHGDVRGGEALERGNRVNEES